MLISLRLATLRRRPPGGRMLWSTRFIRAPFKTQMATGSVISKELPGACPMWQNLALTLFGCAPCTCRPKTTTDTTLPTTRTSTRCSALSMTWMNCFALPTISASKSLWIWWSITPLMSTRGSSNPVTKPATKQTGIGGCPQRKGMSPVKSEPNPIAGGAISVDPRGPMIRSAVNTISISSRPNSPTSIGNDPNFVTRSTR